MKSGSDKLEDLKVYYSKTVQTIEDLKTSTCKCDDESLSQCIRAIEKKIDNEILTRVYGCGSPIPAAIDECVVLDLGCGAGRDVYIASSLVGPKGFAIGIDMTDEQLKIARRHLGAQMKRFGYEKPNVEFKKGYIEDLKEIGVRDNSVDIVISNCVINLSPDKRAVFSEIFRILKPGGELYFSDIFAGRRVPEHLKDDPVLHGECLSGAMYIEDFRRLLREIGCMDYRMLTNKKVSVDNTEIKARIRTIDFYSMTVRAFKLDTLEDICEDYGQTAEYLGTIKEYPDEFILDEHHKFMTGKSLPVCGNTASMLSETRFAKHFKVAGDRSVHKGPFDCTPSADKNASDGKHSTGCC